MNEDLTTKKVFNSQPIGTQRKGRPNLGWIDGLEKDLLVLRTRNWRTLARRRLDWERLLEKAKAHPWPSQGLAPHLPSSGLSCPEEGRKDFIHDA
ncbi:uncharacterized protein TNCV_674681 [Trichonephila clavipes]|nr:uncharacterized protein TNCV_674681 [Trichonephila clavipes]